jgi:hypothetical protein
MPDPLLDTIEQYLQTTGLSATRFERLAVKDPRFVEDLRAGRVLRAKTSKRVQEFLVRYDGKCRALTDCRMPGQIQDPTAAWEPTPRA